MDTFTAALVFQVTAGILVVIIGSLLLHTIIRTAITAGMKSYKRWERSGDA